MSNASDVLIVFKAAWVWRWLLLRLKVVIHLFNEGDQKLSLARFGGIFLCDACAGLPVAELSVTTDIAAKYLEWRAIGCV